MRGLAHSGLIRTHSVPVFFPHSTTVDLPFIACEVCELTLASLWNQSEALREKEGEGRVRTNKRLQGHGGVGGIGPACILFLASPPLQEHKIKLNKATKKVRDDA